MGKESMPKSRGKNPEKPDDKEKRSSGPSIAFFHGVTGEEDVVKETSQPVEKPTKKEPELERKIPGGPRIAHFAGVTGEERSEESEMGVTEKPGVEKRTGKKEEVLKMKPAKEKPKKKTAEEKLPKIKRGAKKSAEKTPAAKISKAEKPKITETKEKESALAMDTVRENYVRAKLAYKEKAAKISGFKNLTEAQQGAHFELDPAARQILKEFEEAKKIYLETRQEDLRVKLESIDQELTGDKIAADKKALELKKAGSLYLAAELKKAYDAQTKLLAEISSSDKPWLVQKAEQMGKFYKELPLSKKLAVSGALLAGGMTVGAVSGGAGLALATLIGGGKLIQRAFASAGYFVALEAGIKHYQNKELEEKSQRAYQELVNKTFEEGRAKTAKGLVNFLQLRNAALEKQVDLTTQNLQQTQKRMNMRRYLLAGTLGVLVGSGLAATGVRNIFELGGAETAAPVAEIKNEALIPSDASPEAVVAATETQANQVVTIEKGQGVWQAARHFVETGQMSETEFRETIKNSWADVNGVKVPLKDLHLVHENDQIIWHPGEGGLPGHLEVVDYAKDKLSLGTGKDLSAIYEKLGKQPPAWLTEAVGNGHGTAAEAVVEKTLTKSSATLNQALFDSFMSKTNLSTEEYQAVKNLTVEEFLQKRGRSFWLDYFWGTDAPFSREVDGREILRQRKLANLIRLFLPSKVEQALTVDQFLKVAAKART